MSNRRSDKTITGYAPRATLAMLGPQLPRVVAVAQLVQVLMVGRRVLCDGRHDGLVPVDGVVEPLV